MNQADKIAVLSALSPEALAERQRIVDAAVRYARRSRYCETFNQLLRDLMPEMVVNIDGNYYALDSDGRACSQTEDSDRRQVWDWYHGTYSNQADVFGEDGYNLATGFDRDGFSRVGYDADGFDVNDHGRAYQRVTRRTRWVDENGVEQSTVEQVYTTGYGRYSFRDAEGNLRVGRPATPEELAAEAATRAEWEAKNAGRFNPTTWKHDAVITESEPSDDDDDDDDDYDADED